MITAVGVISCPVTVACAEQNIEFDLNILRRYQRRIVYTSVPIPESYCAARHD